MSDATLLRLTEQGLLLALYCAGPPLVAAALAGAVTDLIARRAGIEDPGLPRVARVAALMLTVLALAPLWAGQLARFASALWTALPALGQ
jgi:type III secretory pathway component EscS